MRQKPLWRCSLYYSGTDTAYKCEERTNYTFRPRGRRASAPAAVAAAEAAASVAAEAAAAAAV